MSCICETLKNNYDTEIAQGDWNTMYFRKENDDYYIRACGDGYVSIKINHCPFCGNKLAKDKYEYEGILTHREFRE